jgi:hypothetical protein
LRRFIYESGHYFVAIGLALIGLGVYLEIASKSPDKHMWAAMAFAYGASWILTLAWILVEPRVKLWRRMRATDRLRPRVWSEDQIVEHRLGVDDFEDAKAAMAEGKMVVYDMSEFESEESSEDV